MPDLPEESVADVLLSRAGDPRPGLLFEDQRWSWGEVVERSQDWGDWLLAQREQHSDGPFHVGVLLDNVPEFTFLFGAAALAGAVLVGLNPTRSPEQLRRDVDLTECAFIVTERSHTDLARAASTGLDVHVADDHALPHLGRRDPAAWSASAGTPDSLFLLLFTSGTSGAPKAVRCSNGPIVRRGRRVAVVGGITAADVGYEAMPLFHSAAVIAGWAPMLTSGATLALRRRFSASQFMPDVRRFGATYVNYVGKPLAYVLAQPPQPDDGDNPMRVAFGNEGSEHHVRRFAARFACQVLDLYGSTEGGVNIARGADSPPGSLGRPTPEITVLDPLTAKECPPGIVVDGVLQNYDEAVGELVNLSGSGSFEGYYGDDTSTSDRLRDGRYWTGDLAYRDAEGYLYFVGRSSEWLRVDGENLGVAPIEAVLAEHPDVVAVAVYGVPDEAVGDQVMAALVLREGANFDGAAFGSWLVAQHGYSAKAAPRYLRIATSLPQTETNKVLRRNLIAQAWDTADELWHRDQGAVAYRLFTAADRCALAERFTGHGRVFPSSITPHAPAPALIPRGSR
jgi:fatty-acyl-CoA synthase